MEFLIRAGIVIVGSILVYLILRFSDMLPKFVKKSKKEKIIKKTKRAKKVQPEPQLTDFLTELGRSIIIPYQIQKAIVDVEFQTDHTMTFKQIKSTLKRFFEENKKGTKHFPIAPEIIEKFIEIKREQIDIFSNASYTNATEKVARWQELQREEFEILNTSFELNKMVNPKPRFIFGDDPYKPSTYNYNAGNGNGGNGKVVSLVDVINEAVINGTDAKFDGDTYQEELSRNTTQ